MLKIILSFCIIFSLNFTQVSQVFTFTQHQTVFAEKAIPPYAKWGRLAMQKAKENYPKSDIIDYLHIGREVRGDVTIERFKLWLRENNKEFGIFITITFRTDSEELIDFSIKKAAS